MRGSSHPAATTSSSASSVAVPDWRDPIRPRRPDPMTRETDGSQRLRVLGQVGPDPRAGWASSGWNGSTTSMDVGACGLTVINFARTGPKSSGIEPCPKWVEVVGPSTLVAVARIDCVVTGSVLEPRWTTIGWNGTITVTGKLAFRDKPVRVGGVRGVIERVDVALVLLDEPLSGDPGVRLFTSCGLTPPDPVVDLAAKEVVETKAGAPSLWPAYATRPGINVLATGLPIPVARSYPGPALFLPLLPLVMS